MTEKRTSGIEMVITAIIILIIFFSCCVVGKLAKVAKKQRPEVIALPSTNK